MKKVIIILVVLAVLGGGGFFAWKTFFHKGEEEKKEVVVSELTAEELAKLTYKFGEKEADISTNIMDGNVNLRFDVVLESEKAKHELEVRSSQMHSMTMESLRSFYSEELDGAEGKKKIESVLKEKFNSFLKSGKVLEVWVVSIQVM